MRPAILPGVPDLPLDHQPVVDLAVPVVRARLERLAELGHDVGPGLADDRHRRVADPLLVAAGRRRGAGLAVDRPLAADPALGPDQERGGA